MPFATGLANPRAEWRKLKTTTTNNGQKDNQPNTNHPPALTAPTHHAHREQLEHPRADALADFVAALAKNIFLLS